MIGKVLKWFKVASTKVLSPLHKTKFNNIPDPIGNILPKLGLAKLEIEIESLIIIIVGPHKDFYIIDVLGISYISFIGINSIIKNKSDIKSDFS